jgi:hypothetical protein
MARTIRRWMGRTITRWMGNNNNIRKKVVGIDRTIISEPHR